MNDNELSKCSLVFGGASLAEIIYIYINKKVPFISKLSIPISSNFPLSYIFFLAVVVKLLLENSFILVYFVKSHIKREF